MTPKPFQKIQNLFTEALFVASVVLLGALFFFMFLLRSKDLIDLAKFLPEENTHALFTLDLREYEANTPQASPLLTQIFGEPLAQQAWFKTQVGLVWMDGGRVQFLEVNDRATAEDFFKTRLAEGEEWSIPAENPQLTCYSYSHPECFAFTGPFLMVSSSVDALNQVLLEGPTLRESANYQNVKGRLPLLSDGFVYMNAESSRLAVFSMLGQLGIHEPGYLESVYRLFPAYGLSLNLEQGQWTAESVTLADKTQLEGAPYAHPTSKYHGRLLDYSSDQFFLEWGGVNLWEQKEAVNALLEHLNSAAALTFRASLEEVKQKLFGELPMDTLKPLFEKEFYLGWTPGGDFLLILETPEPDPAPEENTLVNYRAPQITHVRVNELLILSSSSELLQASVDRLEGRQEKRDLSTVASTLMGADEFWRFDLEFLPETHILKTLLPNVDSLVSTRKRFDDGFYTRHTLIFRP